MRSSSDTGGHERASHNAETKKSGHNPGRGQEGAKLYVVGTGPGHASHMSGRAKEVIGAADCIAGYTTYIRLIDELVKDKEIISTGMMKEMDRVEQAIDLALSGKKCALVSGGDPGIYAMAGLVFDGVSRGFIRPVATAPPCPAQIYI